MWRWLNEIDRYNHNKFVKRILQLQRLIEEIAQKNMPVSMFIFLLLTVIEILEY